MQPSTYAMPDAKRRAAAEDVNGKGVFKTKICSGGIQHEQTYIKKGPPCLSFTEVIAGRAFCVWR